MRVNAWCYVMCVVGIFMLASIANGDIFDISYAGNTSYGYSDLEDVAISDEMNGGLSNNPFLGFALTEIEAGSSVSKSDSTNDTEWGSSSIQALGNAMSLYEGDTDADYKSLSKSKSVIEFTIHTDIEFLLNVEAESTAQDNGNRSTGSLINSDGLIIAEWNSNEGRNFQFQGVLEKGEIYRLVATVRSRVKDGMDDGYIATGSFDLVMIGSVVGVPLPSAALFGFAGLTCLGLVPRRRRS